MVLVSGCLACADGAGACSLSPCWAAGACATTGTFSVTPCHVIRPGALDLQRLVVHEDQGLDPIPISEFFRDLGFARGFNLNLAPLAPHDVEVPINIQQIGHNGFGFRLRRLRRRRRGFPLGALLGLGGLRNGRKIFRHSRHVIGPGALDLQRLVVHQHQGLDPIAVLEFFP